MHLFNEIKVRIDIQSNLQIENFLDISFLSSNTAITIQETKRHILLKTISQTSTKRLGSAETYPELPQTSGRAFYSNPNRNAIETLETLEQSVKHVKS